MGESSTRIGDFLGSPRVATQSYVLFCFCCLFICHVYCIYEKRHKIYNSDLLRVKRGHKNKKNTIAKREKISDPIRTLFKCVWARVVLGWVTSWEVLVLHPNLFFFFASVIHSYALFLFIYLWKTTQNWQFYLDARETRSLNWEKYMTISKRERFIFI